MSYDGFYGDLSTRGSVNELLNQANNIKVSIEASAAEVAADTLDVDLKHAEVEQRAAQVQANATFVGIKAQEVQVNSDYVAGVVIGGLMTDAPADGNTYARKDNDWVLSAVTKEHLDVNLYWPAPASNLEAVSGVLARMYPRHNLSGAILPSCYARREIPSSTENLTLEITSTNPAKTWKATCVIPAGEREGFFTSGSEMDMDSTEGFVIKPNPAPTGAVTGLSLSLRWEILADQSFQRLFVPQPSSVNTVIIHGVGVGPTFTLEKLSTGLSMTSQDVGGNINDSKDVSVSNSSDTMVFLRSDNSIISSDIRSGFTLSTLTSSNPRRGISLNRSSTKFVTTEVRGSDVWLMEYNYPDNTLAHEMQLVGVTSVNSVRYAPNDRFILIGHSSGLLLLNALTYLPTTITNPPVGEVFDAMVSPSLYAILCRQDTGVTLHVVNNGEPMAYLGSKSWSNTTSAEFNWDTTEDMPYPHFVVGGMNTSGAWEVIPYKAESFDYNEMSWKIDFGEEIIGMTFSEADLSSGVPKESIFGRALIVFGKTKYKVYSLASGVEVATQSVSDFTQITGGVWKEAQGLYE